PQTLSSTLSLHDALPIYWDFFKTQAGDGDYGYGASLLRLSISRQFQSKDWFFELAQPSLIGLPSHAIAPPPQGQLGFGGTYFAADRKSTRLNSSHEWTSY